MAAAEVKEMRKALGITQRELGRRLGITTQQISNYESGRSPVPRVVKLAIQHIASSENYDESAFLKDWDCKDMEAYNAL